MTKPNHLPGPQERPHSLVDWISHSFKKPAAFEPIVSGPAVATLPMAPTPLPWPSTVLAGDLRMPVAKKPSILDFAITREEVERGLIGAAVDHLMQLTDTPQNCLDHTQRIRFCFLGYDHDPRELHEIHEVVSFFRALNSHWPYWFHFMRPDTDAMALLMTLVSDTEATDREGLVIKGRCTHVDQVWETMESMVQATKCLHATHGMPGEVRQQVADGVIDSLRKALIS